MRGAARLMIERRYWYSFRIRLVCIYIRYLRSGKHTSLREDQIGKPKLDLVFECARAHAMRDVLVEFTAASPPDYCPTMNILIKRVYEEPDADDGTRILVDRLWPRGLSKEKARVDLWLKDVAPSTNLRKWFAHDPAKWTEFQARYREELKKRKEQITLLRQEAAKGTITLLYGARDQQHNEAVVLQRLLNLR